MDDLSSINFLGTSYSVTSPLLNTKTLSLLITVFSLCAIVNLQGCWEIEA